MLRTNPDSLRSWLCFRVFRLNFASDFFNLLLTEFHQAEIIIVKHLIQRRNDETWLGVEPLTLRSWGKSRGWKWNEGMHSPHQPFSTMFLINTNFP